MFKRQTGKELTVKPKSFLLSAILVLACLAAGWWSGPLLRNGYQYVFPKPAFVTGNYDALYQQTGVDVVMFSTTTCPFCAQARQLLNASAVEYVDLVIDQSEPAKRQFNSMGAGGVPQIFIADRRITGFHEAIIREAIKNIKTRPNVAQGGVTERVDTQAGVPSTQASAR